MVTLGTDWQSATGDPVILDDEARLRHMLIVGTTGTGKSNLMQAMMLDDAAAGHGFVVIDPFGQLSQDLLERLPEKRERDVIFLDASDRAYHFGLNLFDTTGVRDEWELDERINAVVESFRRIRQGAPDAITVVLWARAIARTLMENRTGTILDASRLLTDVPYRERLLRKVTDEQTLAFWEQYKGREGKIDRTSTAGIMNRLQELLSNGLMKAIVGQQKTTIKFGEWIDRNKIVVIRIEDTIGRDQQRMLGAFLLQRFIDAGKRRSLNNRHPFFFYVDEFHKFATADFVNIVNEMRQFGIGLVAATQQMHNIPDDDVRRGMMGVGNMVLFNLVPDDVHLFAPYFTKAITECYEPCHKNDTPVRTLLAPREDEDVPSIYRESPLIESFLRPAVAGLPDPSSVERGETLIDYYLKGFTHEEGKPKRYPVTSQRLLDLLFQYFRYQLWQEGVTVVYQDTMWKPDPKKPGWEKRITYGTGMQQQVDAWHMQFIDQWKANPNIKPTDCAAWIAEGLALRTDAKLPMLTAWCRWLCASIGPLVWLGETTKVYPYGTRYILCRERLMQGRIEVKDALLKMTKLYGKGVAYGRLLGHGEKAIQTPLVDRLRNPLMAWWIVDQSREKYCREHADVLREINRRDDDEGDAEPPKQFVPKRY